MSTVNTLESPPGHSMLLKTIWTTSSRFNHWIGHAVQGRCNQEGFHCQQNGAMPNLSLPAPYIHIGNIWPLPYQYQCTSTRSQPSIYYVSLTLYPPRGSRFPTHVETQHSLNSQPEEITNFLNIKWLLLR
jgi:hypothetical protein